ncbi:Protocadherin-1 [Fasciola gigantica]|uniref:Protocadherin-1 n=1 Tax=Fasciola gigantica TaxID=46835 RepID=A0A504YQI5_FASGI|nr:Protocadherin-1 [Fasciola gigantica]
MDGPKSVILHFLIMNWLVRTTSGDLTKSLNPLQPRNDLAYTLGLGGEPSNRFQLMEECANGTEVNGVSVYLQQNVELIHSTSSLQKPEIHYNFQLLDIQDPLAQVLYLDPRSGRLTVSGRVDRETLCLELGARKPNIHATSNVPSLYGTDFGPPYGSSSNKCVKKLRVLSTAWFSGQKQPEIKSLPIEILIEDVNDNSPEWRDLPVWSSFGSDQSGPDHVSVIELQLPEMSKDLAPGHLAPSVRISLPLAHDPDDGLNGRLDYRIEPIQSKAGLSGHSQIALQSSTSLPFLLEKHLNGQLDLIATTSLDYEKQSLHQFYLLASDSGSPPLTGTALVKVHLVDVNDEAPVFDRPVFYPAAGAVSEKTAPGTLLLNLSAADSDGSFINSRVRYSMAPNTMAFKYFTVHPDGRVTLRHWLDYESMDSSAMLPLPAGSDGPDSNNKKRFVFQVLAVDSAPQPYEKTGTAMVVIPVTDDNDEAPVITIRYLGTPDETNHGEIGAVQENNAVPTRLAYIQVTDPDFEGRDQLVCHLSDNSNFSLTPISSLQSPDIGFANEPQEEIKNDFVLSLLTRADREQTPLLFVRIKCLDQAGNANEQTIRIRVLDVNDESPKFSQTVYRFVVPENTNPEELGPESRKLRNQPPWHGYRIGRVSAQDADHGANSKLTYRLEPNSLQIVKAKIMDRGLDPVEQQSHGAFVFHPLAEAKPNLVDLFSIEPDTGIIRALKSFDAENVDLFRFTVCAVDQPDDVAASPRTGNTTVEVKVTDVNDWSPMFYLISPSDQDKNTPHTNLENQLEFVTGYVFHVKENRPAFWLVGRVAAIDPDVSLQNHYHQSTGQSLSASQSPLSLRISPEADPDIRRTFTLHASSGHLRTVTSLDREAKAVHIFHILASDTNRDSALSRTGTATVTVFVEDENDNSPVFVRPIAVTRDSTQSRTISSPNEKRYQSNATVTASTADGGMRKNNGQAGNLLSDHLAEDNRALLSTGTNIKNSGNQEGPVPFVVVHRHTWTQPMDNAGNQQTAHSRSLLQLEATDADAGENGMVTYHIGAGNRDGLFQLDNTTGTLMLSPEAWVPIHGLAHTRGVQETAALSGTHISQDKGHSMYLLRFEACDRGIPKRCALPIWVRIMLDMNDMPHLKTKDNLGILASPYSGFRSDIEGSTGELGRFGSGLLIDNYMKNTDNQGNPNLARSQASVSRSQWSLRNGADRPDDQHELSSARFDTRDHPFGKNYFKWSAAHEGNTAGTDLSATSGLVINEAVIICLVVIFIVLLCATSVLIYLVRRRVIFFGQSSHEKTKGGAPASKRLTPNDFIDQPARETKKADILVRQIPHILLSYSGKPLEVAENGSVYQVGQGGLTVLPEGIRRSTTTTPDTSNLASQCDRSSDHFVTQPLIRRNSDSHLGLTNGVPYGPSMTESIYMGNGPFRQQSRAGADYQSLLLKDTTSFRPTNNTKLMGRSVTPFCEIGTKYPNFIKGSVYNSALMSPRWRSMTYHNPVSPLYRLHSPAQVPPIHDYARNGQYPMIRDVTALTSSLYATHTPKLSTHLRGNSTPIYSREAQPKWPVVRSTMDTSHTYHELSTLTATLRKHNYSSPLSAVRQRDEQHTGYSTFRPDECELALHTPQAHQLPESHPRINGRSNESLKLSTDTHNMSSQSESAERKSHRNRSQPHIFQTAALGQSVTNEFSDHGDEVIQVIENPQEHSAPVLLSGFETFRPTDATMKTSSSSLPLILDTVEDFGTSSSPEQEQNCNQNLLPQSTTGAPGARKYIYQAYREASFV